MLNKFLVFLPSTSMEIHLRTFHISGTHSGGNGEALVLTAQLQHRVEIDVKHNQFEPTAVFTVRRKYREAYEIQYL